MATTEDTTGWLPLAEPQAAEALFAHPDARERSLMDVFATTVERHPAAIALDGPDATLTYAELADEVGCLAARLREAGAGPGERVGVRIASGRSELYTAILGVLHAGAAYVPVDADDPPARAQTIWAQADVCGVLDLGPEHVAWVCWRTVT